MLKKAGAIFGFALYIGCFVTHAHGARADSLPVDLATLYFKIDSAEINPKFEHDLQKIQAALKGDPAMGLRIVGYAHQNGTPQENHAVSQKRVQAVQQWFLKQGIAKSRLITRTFADTQTTAQKSGSQDSVRSERVEILQISHKQPLAVLPAAVYRFNPVVEGQEVAHAFVVQNKGSAPLEIRRVKTD
jgi:hypothetical protein